MSIFKTELTDYVKVKKGTKLVTLMKREKFDKFNEDILGLGKIETKSEQINALAVLFDLEGFTNFCKQIDPQLAVPEYLSEFLKWLFLQIRDQLVNETYPEGYQTYSDLPLLSKFMGDGILFLWDVENLSDTKIHNIVVAMNNICVNYQVEFYKEIVKKIVTPPQKLRCGIARGAIYSVGNGNDFVGPCINMSARLQKLHSLTFCFSRRGLNPKSNAWLDKNTVTKKTVIRGIGNEELVCILKIEYNALTKTEQENFIEP